MVVANVLHEKKCVFEILQRLDYKGCCLISVFVVILRARGRCCFPSAGSLEELSATVKMCKEIWLVAFLFSGMKLLLVIT